MQADKSYISAAIQAATITRMDAGAFGFCVIHVVNQDTGSRIFTMDRSAKEIRTRLVLAFALRNELELLIGLMRIPVCGNGNQLLFVPGIENDIQIEMGGGGEALLMELGWEAYGELIPGDHHLRERIGEDKRDFHLLNDKPGFISSQLRELVHQILYTRLTGHYRNLYLRGKIHELVMHQLLMESEPKLRSVRNDWEGLNRMHLVKELIRKDLSAHHSIPDLARQVGTNDNYLKKQFKEIYGTTVYGYLHSQRMEQGHRLLEDSDRKITDVARDLGYKQPSHFAKAFKKYHGYLPNEIR